MRCIGHTYARLYSLGAGVKGTFGGRKLTADVSYTNFGDLLDAPIRVSIGGEF